MLGSSTLPVAAGPAAGRRHGVVGVCLFVLATVSALKGLHRAVAPEVLYFYYTDYEYGFILRGLVGQIFSPLLSATEPQMHGSIMLVWHVASLTILLVVLSYVAAGLVVTAGRVEVLAMTVLLFCSPIIPSLAFFVAAPDVLLCLLTLGVVAAMCHGRLVLAWLLFLLGTIIHQLMVFIALPVMVLTGLLQVERQRLAVAGSIGVGLLACLVVLAAPPADERFIQRYIDLGITPDGARDLYDFQLRQSLTNMLGKMGLIWRAHFLNGVISLIYGVTASLAILSGCLRKLDVVRRAVARLVPVPEGRWRTVLAALLVLGAGLGPLVVLAIAWDFSRLAVLSTFTSYLTMYVLFRRPDEEPSSSSPVVTASSSLLALITLCLPLLALWPAGMKLNDELPIVRNPVMDIPIMKTTIERFRTFYDRDRLQPVRVDG